jgi:TRAP-type C4-dicarboxylate transport system permease small subunit
MKIYKAVLDAISKAVSVILIMLVSGIVLMMLTELAARNFFNYSFRFSTELCGFMFMWMAFLGVIVLYHNNTLISLDILYRHVPKPVRLVFWVIGRIAAAGLGAIMIVAYCGMYKFNSTSYFSTMQFLSKAWHFLPMAIAGGYLVLCSIYQLLDQFTNPASEQV